VDVFTTREQATGIWMAVFILTVLLVPAVRSAIGPPLKTLLTPPILTSLLLYIGWIIGVIALAYQVGIWDFGLLKDAVLWFIASSAAAYFSATKVGREPRFFRKAILEAIGFSAVLEFWLNEVQTFSLPVELLVVQPVAFTLALLAGISSGKARGCFNTLLTAFGLTILTVTSISIVKSWSSLDKSAILQALLFFAWMPIAVLPFVYILAFWLTHGSLFSLLEARTGRGVPVGVRIGIFVGLHGDLAAAREISKIARSLRDIPPDAGIADTVRAVANFRFQRHRDLESARLAKARLRWYSGDKGYRHDGTKLDQREFASTKEALRLLASWHRGWYSKESRFLGTVLDFLDQTSTSDLPEPHGVVMEIRPDGQAWFAWRRTIGGHVLAIGSFAESTEDWLYEGPQAPRGYPGDGAEWSAYPAPIPPDWRDD
jgi:hypothetical protein